MYIKPETGSEISIAPGVSILGVLSNLNYEPWFALAEYVDNSIQSAAKSLLLIRKVEPDFHFRVDIQYDPAGSGRIVIEDNAGGIARSDFPRAFRAAEVPPDRTGLSEFGMGMKSASIWFAKNWRVVTTSVGDPAAYTVEFDMTRVLTDKVDHLEVVSEPAHVGDHYTRIELWNLNQKLPGRTLGKVREHLREIYRGFLRQGNFTLTVVGQRMEYIEPEVLVAQDYRAGDDPKVSAELKVWRKEIKFTMNDDIEISGWAAIRAEGKTSGNGLSLFRRGRVIVGSGESAYKPRSIYGGGNSYRSQRLFGELEIKGVPVSHTKDGFQWHEYEEEFERILRSLLDQEPLPLLKQAENYRSRKAGRIESQRIQDATENTAAVAEKRIPSTLHSIDAEALFAEDFFSSSIPNPDLEAQSDDPESMEGITRRFSFAHRNSEWTLELTAADRPADSRWLIRQVDPETTSGSVTITLIINTAHTFIKQFALGSTDALEAVFRIAVALVVAESLAVSAGDGETASTFLRQVDTLLSEALSRRLKDSV